MDRYISKVILIGSDLKSQLHQKHFGENFNSKVTDILNTIGADFAIKQVFLSPNSITEFQVWDVNTKEQFKNLRKKSYKGLSSVILVFDSTDPSTLFDLDHWFEEICELSRCCNISIILLSSSSSNDEKAIVNKVMVDEFISKICMKHMLDQGIFEYYETSIEKGENIDVCFLNLSRLLLKNREN